MDVIHQNVLSNGVYQTMLTKAAVLVTAVSINFFFVNSVVIVLTCCRRGWADHFFLYYQLQIPLSVILHTIVKILLVSAGR